MIIKLAKYYLSLHYWNVAPISIVRKMQLRRFKEIFEYARAHSKFYHEFYKEHGVHDLNISTWDDVAKVPIVSKSILRTYSTRDIMTCEMDENINILSTSGSTGEPFKIALNKYEDYTSHVRLTNAMMSYGYNPLKKLVLLSRYEPGHKFEVEDDLKKLKLIQSFFPLFRREVISIFEPIPTAIDRIIKSNPYVLWSTPSIIQLLAIELERQNRRLDVPLLVTMAETMSDDQVTLFRDRICRNLLDDYGCMEAPSLGFSYNSLAYKNIVCNTTLTEVINSREIDGITQGDIVATNLISKTMPFIRYDLGDIVEVLDDKNFPNKRIGRVHGRLDDTILLDNGDSLTYHKTYQLFHDFHQCKQYKFLQRRDGKVILQLQIDRGANKDAVAKAVWDRWLKKYPEASLEIEWVDRFTIDARTGKFKVLEVEKQ